MNNKETADEIRCEDPVDFRKLYDATMQLLFKVSYRIVNDEEAAEDLVHDSFIKANEKAMVFPSLDDAKFWLIRVVKNASLNYAKRKGREAKAYHKALYEGRQHFDSGEVDLLKAETIEKVKEILDKLPPKMKEVLVLREYGDLNYKEIGEALGITEGNVKVRVFRAREQIQKMIGEGDVYMP
ncbi:MAG: sigma-70 family RNA polymerase sigma factor [Treponema sp.]|nr:sigma-70 family RNA polymerase sigma factor [Treponema sp.]